jgi:hypothetical protein
MTPTRVSHAHPEASAMLYPMKSRRPSSQMPPLGTVMRDEEAAAGVERWIAVRRWIGTTVAARSRAEDAEGAEKSCRGLRRLRGFFIRGIASIGLVLCGLRVLLRNRAVTDVAVTRPARSVDAVDARG